MGFFFRKIRNRSLGAAWSHNGIIKGENNGTEPFKFRTDIWSLSIVQYSFFQSWPLSHLRVTNFK